MTEPARFKHISTLLQKARGTTSVVGPFAMEWDEMKKVQIELIALFRPQWYRFLPILLLGSAQRRVWGRRVISGLITHL